MTLIVNEKPVSSLIWLQLVLMALSTSFDCAYSGKIHTKLSLCDTTTLCGI